MGILSRDNDLQPRKSDGVEAMSPTKNERLELIDATELTEFESKPVRKKSSTFDGRVRR